MTLRILLVLACLLPSTFAQEKVLRFPIRADGPKSLDPVRGSSQYESICCDQVYDALLQYKYNHRSPYELEGNLVESMPEVTANGTVYRFKLRKGVRFQDDGCFPGGKGRELVSKDVFYSWKRMADLGNKPRSWWLLAETIKGFDAYRDAQNKAAKFDYDAPVEGMKILNDHEFEVHLTKPVTRFPYVIAMFQTAIVPREAVEKYGEAFGNHPVGTGPFMLAKESDWERTKGITLVRNPSYREEFYPASTDEVGKEMGNEKAAGQRLPFLDRIEITFFTQDQPMWLEWLSGNLDYVQVPAENFTEAFTKRKQSLKKKWRQQNVSAFPVPLLDFIFRGFNMDDPLVGGYTEEKRNLRQAMHLAHDLLEFNDTFYNGINVVYDGPIPPGLKGHPKNHLLDGSFQGPDLDRARELLAKAGYPEGRGLPQIEYWTSASANGPEQAEMIRRQMLRIGVRLKTRIVDFSQMSQAVHEKRAQMFGFAWGSDYPDAENNLALFYGPNESPGSNSFNYKNPEFDRLYEQALKMIDSPERTALYVQLRDMVLKDCPYIGSMARTRFYLTRPWLKNVRPTETFWTWYKYLDIDVDAQKKK